jgi:hypothetical protein
MGLFKRGQVWWMRFSFNGKQVRKPTETTDKKLAEKIHHKVMTQIAEGKWFEKPIGADKTLAELLDKYLKEHSTPNKAASTVKNDTAMVKEMKEFFGDVLLQDVTPSLISAYKTKCREKELAPATINHRRTLLRLRNLYTSGNGARESVGVSRERVSNEGTDGTLEEEKRCYRASPSPTRKENMIESGLCRSFFLL